ncbi:class I SAM-dependent methyltransferase [Mycobacterium sp. 1274761.0]|uniref:class I SAM-dependent methyltransferase n=1 Tax=Mycobacterium sp. 1274761.0 TaxID=1834077 RepID=UPI0007FD9068|nr:class I SAM-dependent methyltransferase [Mycobacterium sp. 1274761.0]OBK74406.1 hypothetical protein A5651_09845 [Mycobacterium sp. 1274761.0]
MRWQWRVNSRDVRRFDRTFDIDTAGTLEPTELTVKAGDAADGFVYVGTPLRLARWWLTALPQNRCDFTFIDMGSGKGRVLVFAAQAGFARAVGIEFAEELHAIALANAHKARAHGLAIEPVLGDAGTFEFPDEPLIVHFNNPFHERVMRRVIANLTASYQAHPRPIIVIFQQMTDEDPAHRTDNLALLASVPYLTERTLELPSGAIDRRLLAPYTVRIYESVEAFRSVTAALR